MLWYAILTQREPYVELQHGTIDTNDKVEAVKRIKKEIECFGEPKQLCLFDSEIAYVFYIKKQNFQWINEKDVFII